MKRDQYVDYKKQTKRCNGPLHLGAQVPLDKFSVHVGKHRPGKYYSRCRDCLNFQRWGEEDHGYVDLDLVWFVFQELENRLGRMETIRRLGVSANFFWRRDHKQFKCIRLKTVKRAMMLLSECRKNEEARHRKSIRHGSKMRGRRERIPKDSHEFYNRYKGSESGFDRIYKNIDKNIEKQHATLTA